MSQKIIVKLTPRSKENKIVSWKNDILRVRVIAPPVDGKANEALIELLAKEWKLPKRAFAIVKGEHAREKVVEVEGNIPLQNRIF